MPKSERKKSELRLSSREKALERQVLVLADRLALSLMLQWESIRGTVLLPSREELREELREEPEYERLRLTIRDVLKSEIVKERKRAA